MIFPWTFTTWWFSTSPGTVLCLKPVLLQFDSLLVPGSLCFWLQRIFLQQLPTTSTNIEFYALYVQTVDLAFHLSLFLDFRGDATSEDNEQRQGEHCGAFDVDSNLCQSQN